MSDGTTEAESINTGVGVSGRKQINVFVVPDIFSGFKAVAQAKGLTIYQAIDEAMQLFIDKNSDFVDRLLEKATQTQTTHT